MRYLALAYAALFVAALAAAKWEGLTPIADLVQAAQTAPDLENDSCVVLGQQMDWKEATPAEHIQFSRCLYFLQCVAAQKWAETATEPPKTLKHFRTLMQYSHIDCESLK